MEPAVDVLNQAYSQVSDAAMWMGLIQKVVKIVLIIVVADLFKYIGKTTVRNLFRLRPGGPGFHISDRRKDTLVKLSENILSYVVYFIAFLMVLQELNIDIKALLAGAGIVGLAVGFGAQNLVKDILTGFFIIFENQFSVGDYVRIKAYEGYVEEIGLRVTKVKNWTGELHIIPNSNIEEVTNFSIHNSISVVDINIAYEEDIGKAESIIDQVADKVARDYRETVIKYEVLGVQDLKASEVVLRVIVEVTPMNHWKIGRILRKQIKIALDEQGIEVPYPRLMIQNKQTDGLT